MTSNLESRINNIVHHLSTQIGPRPSGSPGCHAAATYIAEQMEQIGLKVEKQSFTCPDWRCESASLVHHGKAVDIAVNPFSPSCDVAAEIVPAASLAELETADLTGKIALLYGDLTRSPIACKSWFLKDEHDDRIIKALEDKQPAAVLTIQIKPGSTDRLIEDWEFLIPSATLPAESGLTLLSQPPTTVHLQIKTSSTTGNTCNIVGRRAGTRPETIVFCAHYDTKIDTPGAGDNAGGVAAMLATAEILSHNPIEANLEFVAFTNEEYLPLGDDTYWQLAGDEHANAMLLAINFDGLGHILDANTLAIFAQSETFKAAAELVSQAYPEMVWVDPWPESNHSLFAMRGVPALALSSRALWQYAHQRDDTARWISPKRLAEAAHFTARMVETVQSRPSDWFRPPAA